MKMSRLTKTMLALLIINSVASGLFLTGVVDISGVPEFDMVYPLAALFYGLFLISLMMQKEVARFDKEQHAHHNEAAQIKRSESEASFHHGHHGHHAPAGA
jgi:hypothetical protein